MKYMGLKNRFEYILARCFVSLIQMLPHHLGLRLSRILGFLLFDVLRYRRKVALENLQIAFGEDASASIARLGYVSFAMTLADLARLPLLDKSFITRHVKITGFEHLDDALNSGRGAVLVTGHFGSWELMGWVLAKLGYPLFFAAGRQRNPYIQRLMSQLRRESGIEMSYFSDAFKLVKAVKSNRFVAMLADQDAGRKGIFVEFFGRCASTTRAPAWLSLVTGSPLICGFIIRHGIDDYEIVIEKPVYDGNPGVRKIDVDLLRRLTQAYTSLIESYIRKHPDHWLWSHRRWKTKQRSEANSL